MGKRVSKFTISMPEDLLAGIDALAGETGDTRSGVIREASAMYLRERSEADAACERRRRVAGALAIMKSVASDPQRDTRPSLEILREIRAADGLGHPGGHSSGAEER